MTEVIPSLSRKAFNPRAKLRPEGGTREKPSSFWAQHLDVHLYDLKTRHALKVGPWAWISSSDPSKSQPKQLFLPTCFKHQFGVTWPRSSTQTGAAAAPRGVSAPQCFPDGARILPDPSSPNRLHPKPAIPLCLCCGRHSRRPRNAPRPTSSVWGISTAPRQELLEEAPGLRGSEPRNPPQRSSSYSKSSFSSEKPPWAKVRVKLPVKSQG